MVVHQVVLGQDPISRFLHLSWTTLGVFLGVIDHFEKVPPHFPGFLTIFDPFLTPPHPPQIDTVFGREKKGALKPLHPEMRVFENPGMHNSRIWGAGGEDRQSWQSENLQNWQIEGVQN